MPQERLNEDIEQLLQRFNEQEDSERHEDGQGTEDDGIEEIDVYFVRRPKKGEEKTGAAEENAPPRKRPQRNIPIGAFVAIAANVLLTLSVLVFSILPQLTATVTIILIPVEKQVRETASLIVVQGTPTNGQIPARFLPSFTLTQSKKVPATGHGHQDARAAAGALTFYNGSFSAQTVFAGAVFTGADGVQVATNETVTIPANNPPADGQASISAHALNTGSQGNIAALDINGTFSSALFVKNLTPFTGGQSERDYPIVTKTDIQSAVTSLTTTITSSETPALQAQVTAHEGLITLPCTPMVTSDHHGGDEAPAVTVTVSGHCTGVAYDKAGLQTQATRLLTNQATMTLGATYSLLGDIQVTILHATITNKPNQIATIAVSMSGTWGYQITQQAQQEINRLIAGKQKADALHILLSLPGIQGVTMQGLADDQDIPTDISHIHLLVVYGVYEIVVVKEKGIGYPL